MTAFNIMHHRALVTGATGFIGARLVKALVNSGWLVHIVVRSEISVKSIPPYLGDQVVTHVYDGSDQSLAEILNQCRPKIVFHLAALFKSEHDSSDITPLINSNVLFGSQLVEAMINSGSNSLVTAGTAWQHYHVTANEYNPANLYAATKQAFEDILEYYVKAKNLNVITLKLPDTYGPGDTRPKLMQLLLKASKSNENIVMSPGYQLIDLLYVDDVIFAFIAAAEQLLSGCSGRFQYSISSGTLVSVRELVQEVEKIIKKKLPIIWGGRQYRPREVMTPWHGNSLPGWCPKTNLQDGVRNIFLG